MGPLNRYGVLAHDTANAHGLREEGSLKQSVTVLGKKSGNPECAVVIPMGSRVCCGNSDGQ
jgi:hypothetical protein